MPTLDASKVAASTLNKDYPPHRDELVVPVVLLTKAGSSVEQAVQFEVDRSSLNQSLSQGLHPPVTFGSYPRSQTVIDKLHFSPYNDGYELVFAWDVIGE